MCWLDIFKYILFYMPFYLYFVERVVVDINEEETKLFKTFNVSFLFAYKLWM
jgi:hypothetical protein